MGRPRILERRGVALSRLRIAGPGISSGGDQRVPQGWPVRSQGSQRRRRDRQEPEGDRARLPEPVRPVVAAHHGAPARQSEFYKKTPRRRGKTGKETWRAFSASLRLFVKKAGPYGFAGRSSAPDSAISRRTASMSK